MEQLKTVTIHGKEYVEVKTRVQYFRKNFENGCIDTDHVFFDSDEIVCKTKIHVNGALVATGMAHEIKSASPMNKTSFVEICETSSVGRALGMLAIGIESSVDTAGTIKAAIAQQEQDKRTDDLLAYKSNQLGIQLFNAINVDDEDAIVECISEMRGDKALMDQVNAELSVEHAEYMAERKQRLAEEKKEKSAKKLATNKQLAKDFAEKQKAK